MKNGKIAITILIGLFITILCIHSAWAQTITIISPPDETPDATPDLIVTVEPAAGIEYKWDDEDRIIGPLDTTELNTTYGESNVDTNTVLLFHMNEGSGSSVSDASLENNVGTLAGGATWTSKGRFGNAVSFDSVDGMVDVPDSNSLDITTELTLSAWIKMGTPAIGVHMFAVISKGQIDLGTNYSIRYCSSMQAFMFQFLKPDGITQMHFVGVPFSELEGQWRHIAVTYDGSAVNIYMDGEAVLLDDPTSPVMVSNDRDLWIGRNFDANGVEESFTGSIDDIQVIKRALTAEEIESVYGRELAAGSHLVTVYVGDIVESKSFTVGIIVDGIIIDNADAGFSVKGTWGTNNFLPGVYGNDFCYNAAGIGTETATWNAKLANGAGNYEVSVWYPAYTGLATNALFTINRADISDTVVVDQSINGGQWISIGIYEFVNDGTENITLSDKADSWVVADAVKFVPVNKLEDGIVDNVDPGFKVVGIWRTYSGTAVDVYGTDLRYHAAGDGTETATWEAGLFDGAGNYEVFVWYPAIAKLATDAEYIINHANGSDTVLIDQSINGGTWVSLGVFEFTNEGGEDITLTENPNSWVVADAVKFVLPDGIVDNADSDFSVVGAWERYNSTPSISGYGPDFRYNDAGEGSNIATWAAELTDGAGTYEVFVWYYEHPLHASNTPFTINHNDISDTIIVNQRINGGQWVSLGIYEFVNDGTENITLSDAADAWVIADAVRFVRLIID